MSLVYDNLALLADSLVVSSRPKVIGCWQQLACTCASVHTAPAQHQITSRTEASVLESAVMPLPAELPQLNTFTSITVSGCTIQGSLPSEWNESLPNLQQLDLSSNFQLTGRLPKGVCLLASSTAIGLHFPHPAAHSQREAGVLHLTLIHNQRFGPDLMLQDCP